MLSARPGAARAGNKERSQLETECHKNQYDIVNPYLDISFNCEQLIVMEKETLSGILHSFFLFPSSLWPIGQVFTVGPYSQQGPQTGSQ